MLLISAGYLAAQSKKPQPPSPAPGWGEYWANQDSSPPEYTKWRREYLEASKRREYSKALGVSEKMVARYPDMPGALIYRAMAKRALGRFDSARADLDKAIADARANKSSETVSVGLEQMALLTLQQGRPADAQSYFQKAVRETPDEFEMYNNYAWALATSASPASRNGSEAVRLATKACVLSRWADAGCLDTLAAACAETGDFNSAVKWQTKALELAKSSKSTLTDANRRLALYRNHLPYHTDK